MLFSYILLNLCGKEFFQSFNRGGVGVYKQRAAVFDIAGHVVARYVRGVRALYEVRAVNQIFGLNGRIAEAQVRYGNTA